MKAKAIESYNLLTGETVKTFSSLREATLNGYNRSSVYKVLTGFYAYHKGVGWRYAGSTKTDRPTRRVFPRRRPAVVSRTFVSHDLLSGETIQVYSRILAAVAEGYDASGIYKVLCGKRCHYRGLGWRYLNSESTDLMIEAQVRAGLKKAI